MGGLSELRVELLVKANAFAPRNLNGCITCISKTLKDLSDNDVSAVYVCQHFREDDRPLQSRKALVNSGVCDDEDAETVLRCVFCYANGRDCFQVNSLG